MSTRLKPTDDSRRTTTMQTAIKALINYPEPRIYFLVEESNQKVVLDSGQWDRRLETLPDVLQRPRELISLGNPALSNCFSDPIT